MPREITEAILGEEILLIIKLLNYQVEEFIGLIFIFDESSKYRLYYGENEYHVYKGTDKLIHTRNAVDLRKSLRTLL